MRVKNQNKEEEEEEEEERVRQRERVCVLRNDAYAPRRVCEKIEKEGIEPDVNRTRNLLIWSQTRYHCATDPLGDKYIIGYLFTWSVSQ